RRESGEIVPGLAAFSAAVVLPSATTDVLALETVSETTSAFLHVSFTPPALKRLQISSALSLHENVIPRRCSQPSSTSPSAVVASLAYSAPLPATTQRSAPPLLT